MGNSEHSCCAFLLWNYTRTTVLKLKLAILALALVNSVKDKLPGGALDSAVDSVKNTISGGILDSAVDSVKDKLSGGVDSAVNSVKNKLPGLFGGTFSVVS